MADDTVATQPPKISKREELSQAVKAEMSERATRCMARIEIILKEENCILSTNMGFEEIAPGKYAMGSRCGVKAL